MSASGMYWRVSVTLAGLGAGEHVHDSCRDGFAAITVTVATSPDEVAEAVLAAAPALRVTYADPEYAGWYEGLWHSSSGMAGCRSRTPTTSMSIPGGRSGGEAASGTAIRRRRPPSDLPR